MLTKQDYANLKSLLERATFVGINDAMVGIVLFSKLESLINADDTKAVAADGVGSDSP